MPWCPSCKNEYRPGIKICPDCNKELVDDLDSVDSTENISFVDLAIISKEEIAKKLCSYFDYLDIASKYKYTENGYLVFIDESKSEEALTEFKIFMQKEYEKMAMEGTLNDSTAGTIALDDSDSETEISVSSLVKAPQKYKRAKDRYEDYVTSGRMLVVFGVVGLVITFLNILGIMTLFSSRFSQVILVLMFGGMLVIGIRCLFTSKKIATDVISEADEEVIVDKWIEENITPEEINSIEDLVEGNDEYNFIVKSKYLSKKLREQFPDLTDDVIDEKVEDYFSTEE